MMMVVKKMMMIMISFYCVTDFGINVNVNVKFYSA